MKTHARSGMALILAVMLMMLALLSSCGSSSGGSAGTVSTTFLEGTAINGMDVSGMTANEVDAAFAEAVEGYSFMLCIEEDVFIQSAAELNLTYVGGTDFQDLLDAQNEDSSLTDFTVDDLFSADISDLLAQLEEAYPLIETEEEAAEDTEEDTEEIIEESETEAVDPNAPVNAYLIYSEDQGSFVIVADEPGKNVDCSAIAEAALKQILLLNPSLVLELDDYRERAEITAESEELLAALEDANSYLNQTLTYSFTPEGGTTTTVTVSRDLLGSLYYVDSTNTVQVNQDAVSDLVIEWVSAYSASDKTSKFKTTNGEYVDINITEAGQSVDSAALFEDLCEVLSTGNGGTRIAAYETSTDSDAGYWGGNYVEVDLTSQHLWCYKDGVCVVSCDIVSGCVYDGTVTPTGCFTIFAKNTDRYLNGTNVDGTSYSSWVYYFMPFSGGCGIHDATWRSYFGGTIYYYSGSHGCVGVTLANAAIIYENVSIGTHVVVYGGISQDELPGRSQSVTATAESTSLKIGDTTTITVSGNKTDPTFESDDTTVVTVDEEGNITAVGIGSATVTVTCPEDVGYKEATVTLPFPVVTAHTHTWVAETETINHDCSKTSSATTYTCSVCSESFTSESEASSHAATVDTTYSCSGCGTQFTDAAAVEAHIAETEACAEAEVETTETAHTVTSVTTTTYTCTLCGKSFTDKSKAETHSAKTEEAIVGYVCSGCGEVEDEDFTP